MTDTASTNDATERTSDGQDNASGGSRTDKKKPANSAPDAVKDPNEKTDGKPGLPPGTDQGDEADPGGG